MKIGSKINRAPLRRQGIVKFTRSRNAFVSIRAVEKNFNIEKKSLDRRQLDAALFPSIYNFSPLVACCTSHRSLDFFFQLLTEQTLHRIRGIHSLWLFVFRLIESNEKKICSNWGFESLLLFKCRSYDIQHFLHSIRECFIVGWEEKLRRSRRTARNFSEKK